jgi:hypothetical protein
MIKSGAHTLYSRQAYEASRERAIRIMGGYGMAVCGAERAWLKCILHRTVRYAESRKAVGQKIPEGSVCVKGSLVSWSGISALTTPTAGFGNCLAQVRILGGTRSRFTRRATCQNRWAAGWVPSTASHRLPMAPHFRRHPGELMSLGEITLIGASLSFSEI